MPEPIYYAYTQTLAPRYYKTSFKTQYDKTLPIIRKFLQMFTKKYNLIPELTKKSNIHYHGTVQFLSNNDYHSFQDNIRQIGFSDLRPIKDNEELDKWTDYITKNKMETEKLLEKSNILEKFPTNKRHFRKILSYDNNICPTTPGNHTELDEHINVPQTINEIQAPPPSPRSTTLPNLDRLYLWPQQR